MNQYLRTEELRSLYGIRQPVYLHYCEVCWFFSTRPGGLQFCRCWHPSLSFAGRKWRTNHHFPASNSLKRKLS